MEFKLLDFEDEVRVREFENLMEHEKGVKIIFNRL
jgi:hypothetical protein